MANYEDNPVQIDDVHRVDVPPGFEDALESNDKMRCSALEGAYRPGAEGTTGAGLVTLAERRGLQCVLLQSRENNRDVNDRVADSFGVRLPTTTGDVSGEESLTVLTLGPDRWLLVVPARTPSLSLEDWRSALNGRNCGLTDMSHNWSVIRLGGEARYDLLAKLSSLDTHPRLFPAGRCAQTELRGLYAILHRVDEEHFDVWVMRSYAYTLWEWLTDAAAEFDCHIVEPID